MKKEKQLEQLYIFTILLVNGEPPLKNILSFIVYPNHANNKLLAFHQK